MEGAQMTRGLRKRHCARFLAKNGYFDHIIKILIDCFSIIERFNPFFEDLGPFWRLDIGGKLGGCCQLQAYIKQRLLKPKKEVKNQENAEELLSKYIFMQGSH
jgi:hypothetical protein